MKFKVLSLIILSSLVSAMPAPQRGDRRPSAAATTQAAATAAATSAVAAEPSPAVSTKASAAAGTTAATGAAGGTTAGGAAGTAAAGTAAAGTTAAGSDTSAGGDSHKVTVCSLLPSSALNPPCSWLTRKVINNCGSGSVQWQHQDAGQTTFPSGSTTVDKKLVAGLIWLDGYNGFKCGANAVDCGMVELTLGDNGHNAINYSLLMQNLGNHIL